MAEQVGRNDPCPCGSGKKHKRCCLGKAAPELRRGRLWPALIVFALGAGGAFWAYSAKGLTMGATIGVVALVVAIAVYVLSDPPPPRGGKGSDPAAINFGS